MSASNSHDGNGHCHNSINESTELCNHEDEGAESASFPRLSVQTLMETNQQQQQQILNLQIELNQLKVEHKEGIYWLQIQLDTTRREKIAIEESMTELQEDFKHTAFRILPGSLEDGPDPNHEELSRHATLTTGHVDSSGFFDQKRRYEHSLETLENQMNMIKTSFGEINRSLKEEICDLMEDRTRIELELLNQLSALDNEKKHKELELTLQLIQKDEEIRRLHERSSASLPKGDDNIDNFSTATSILSLEDEKRGSILEFLSVKGQRDELVERERREADEIINDMKDEKIGLQRKLETIEGELASMRSEFSKANNVKLLLSQLELEKDAIELTLNRVSSMKHSADRTMETLEKFVDKLQVRDGGDTEENERGQMLSLMESVSLLNAQMNVSLMLIEMQLRNNFQRIKNYRKDNIVGHNSLNDDASKKLEEVNHDALSALKLVETSLVQRIKSVEAGLLKKNKEMANVLKDKASSIADLKNDNAVLQEELTMLRLSNHGPDGEKSQEAGTFETKFVSDAMLDQLNVEVLRVVAVFTNMKDTIVKLKEDNAKRSKREESLRKELKRAIRATSVSHRSANNVGMTTPNSQTNPLIIQQIRSNVEAPDIPFFVSEPDRVFAEMSSPTTTLSQSKFSKQTRYVRRNSTGSAIGDSPSSGTSIRPLRPSPRELFRSKHYADPCSPFPIKPPPLSPTKSPTSVDEGP